MSGSRELLSHDGAEALARELDEWWHSRGHLTAQHWAVPVHYSKHPKHSDTEPARENDRAIIWCVRSNLVGGLPP